MQNRFASLFILLFLLIAAAGCLFLDRPPSPLPANAPPESFSAERALVHLNNFARAPHPIGSAEHDRVRDYLVSQFTNLGLASEIQCTTGVVPRFRAAGTVENIAARLKGTSGAADAVVLSAHYDSVPAGPGAGDDGAGVAAILETLRALRAGPPLRNDIIFLITDGEEDGLLGASAFVAEHPWAKDVRVVVNLEARGNAGPSQMFETSAGNGRLVGIFAQSVPHPNASSSTYEIYKDMPNDTDMTLFKKGGLAGLNFAFIGHWAAYHTPLDNPQQIDRGSLQHHGENVLALARSLGNADLGQLQDADAVYFSLPGGWFVHYSGGRIWLLAGLCAVFFLAAAFYANGAFGTRWSAVFAGLLWSVVLLLLLTVTSFGFAHFVHWLHFRFLPEGDLLQNTPYLLSLLALLLALQTTLANWLRRKIGAAALSLGGSLLILLLVFASSRWLPGGSYVLLWPLFALLLAIMTVAFRPQKTSSLGAAALCVLSLPALSILVPLLNGFFTALGLTSLGAPLLASAFALLLILIAPVMDILLTQNRGLVPAAALLAALVLFAAGAATTKYSPEHPKPSLLAYALDADSGKALWTSSAERADQWTAQYVGVSPERGPLRDYYPDWGRFQFLQHDAPAIALVPPGATLLESSVSGDTRSLHLRITSPRHARGIHVRVVQVEVLEAAVNGHSLGNPSEARWHTAGAWNFDYFNIPPDGLDLQLRVQGTDQVKLIVVDRASGLPSIPGRNLPPRPPDSMPQHWGDETLVLRSFVF